MEAFVPPPIDQSHRHRSSNAWPCPRPNDNNNEYYDPCASQHSCSAGRSYNALEGEFRIHRQLALLEQRASKAEGEKLEMERVIQWLLKLFATTTTQDEEKKVKTYQQNHLREEILLQKNCEIASTLHEATLTLAKFSDRLLSLSNFQALKIPDEKTYHNSTGDLLGDLGDCEVPCSSFVESSKVFSRDVQTEDAIAEPLPGTAPADQYVFMFKAGQTKASKLEGKTEDKVKGLGTIAQDQDQCLDQPCLQDSQLPMPRNLPLGNTTSETLSSTAYDRSEESSLSRLSSNESLNYLARSNNFGNLNVKHCSSIADQDSFVGLGEQAKSSKMDAVISREDVRYDLPKWNPTHFGISSWERKAMVLVHRRNAGPVELNYPDIFKYGIRLSEGSNQLDKYRTVTLGYLPEDLTMTALLECVRGGAVLDAKLLDTMKITGHQTALITFIREASALDFITQTRKRPLYFHGMPATVTLLKTPTWPISARLRNSIFNLGHTRCLEVYNLPRHVAPSVLERDLPVCSVMSTHRIEHKHIEKDGVLKLRFNSVKYAGQAFGLLTTFRKYSQCRVKFVPDPCQESFPVLGYASDAKSHNAEESPSPTSYTCGDSKSVITASQTSGLLLAGTGKQYGTPSGRLEKVETTGSAGIRHGRGFSS